MWIEYPRYPPRSLMSTHWPLLFKQNVTSKRPSRIHSANQFQFLSVSILNGVLGFRVINAPCMQSDPWRSYCDSMAVTAAQHLTSETSETSESALYSWKWNFSLQNKSLYYRNNTCFVVVVTWHQIEIQVFSGSKKSYAYL